MKSYFVFWQINAGYFLKEVFDVKNNILDDTESRINGIVKELCNRSGEYIISLKNEGDNKTFFEEHLTEIAKAVANVKLEDLNNGENDLNKFLFMCIGLFDTNESRQIIYNKLADRGIFYVYQGMSDAKKLKYISHLPEHFRNSDLFFGRLGVNPNSKLAKRCNSVEGFINKHKKENNPWKLAESEKIFFVEHKNEIRDKIASLGGEDFDGDEHEANKYKLLCCQLFSEARDRQVIFETIGDGSDADIILTFQKSKLNNLQVRRELFVYLPSTLQIKEAFQYAGFKDGLLKDLERKMLEEFTFEIWKDRALSLGFIFLLILSVPTGLTDLILWCSSDYREALKQEKIDEKLRYSTKKELSAEDEKKIKSEMKCEFIVDILKSLYPALNFAFVTCCFIVLPFGVFISDLGILIFLVIELGCMIYMFIANFKLIKSLCKGIKDAVKNNRQIQQTLDARREKWKSTLKEIKNKQTRQGVVTEQPKKNLGSGTILSLPDQNLINNDQNSVNNVEDRLNNIITLDLADNLNSNINKENNEINDELITDTNKNLMIDNTSKANKTIQKKQKPKKKKNKLYNKIGSGWPSELDLEPAPEAEEEIEFE